MINKELEFQLKHWIESWKRYGPRVWLWLADCFKIHNMQSLSFTLFEVTNYDTHHCYRCVFSALKAPISEEEERKRPFCCVAMNNLPQFADFPVDGVAKYSIIVDGLTGRVIILKVRVRSILEFAFVNFLMLLVWIFHMHFTVLKSDVIYISPYSSYQVFYVILYLYTYGNPSIRVDGPKASQRSLPTRFISALIRLKLTAKLDFDLIFHMMPREFTGKCWE